MTPTINTLTLDFRADKVVYNARALPTGTIACQALNVPRDRIAQILEYTPPLTAMVEALNNKTCSPELLEPVKASIHKILSLMQDQPPFCYVDIDIIHETIDELFRPEMFIWYPNLCQIDRKNASDPTYRALLCLKETFENYVYMLEHLGYSLGKYLDGMRSFAEELDKLENRKLDGLALATSKHFPGIISFGDESTWMSGTNESCQYLAAKDDNDNPVISRRHHYQSVVGLFRADLFEGLSVGHAPKKCLNCGQWFLTKDGRHTKYCDGIDPNSEKGESCRSVGNRKRREFREKAEDNHFKKLYTTRCDSIRSRVDRGKLVPRIAEKAKTLAKNKLNRVVQDNDYALNHYEAEMELDALIAEAKKELANEGI